MQVKVNEDGYVTDFAEVGKLDDGITVKDPNDREHFYKFFPCYLMRDGTLEFNKKKAIQFQEEQEKDHFRQKRENECFSIINRGFLWYQGLKKKQQEELLEWYHAWLDVTHTRKIPEKPKWLDT